MACEERQHDRRLIVGIEVGPVHGDLDALTRSDDGRHPAHKQFLDINSRVREQPIDLLDGMLAYTALRQSQPVASSIPSFSGVLSNKRIKKAENLSEKNRNPPIDGEDRHERPERVEYWLTV